jgi:hypothetical protein
MGVLRGCASARVWVGVWCASGFGFAFGSALRPGNHETYCTELAAQTIELKVGHGLASYIQTYDGHPLLARVC